MHVSGLEMARPSRSVSLHAFGDAQAQHRQRLFQPLRIEGAAPGCSSSSKRARRSRAPFALAAECRSHPVCSARPTLACAAPADGAATTSCLVRPNCGFCTQLRALLAMRRQSSTLMSACRAGRQRPWRRQLSVYWLVGRAVGRLIKDNRTAGWQGWQSNSKLDSTVNLALVQGICRSTTSLESRPAPLDLVHFLRAPTAGADQSDALGRITAIPLS